MPPVLLRCSGLNEPSHPRQAKFIRTYQSWAKLWSVTVVSNQLRPRGGPVVQAKRFERKGVLPAQATGSTVVQAR